MEHPPEPYTCIECGEPGDADSFYGGTAMRAKTACFKCYHWLKLVDVANEPDIVRVNGNHYHIQPEGTRFPGFAGREFKVLFNDGRRVTTRNLWHQGEIPERFRARLPNNAKFEGGV